MPRRIEDAPIDEAAEDPPLLLLTTAVIGVLLTVGGLLWIVLSLFVVVPIPVGDPILFMVVGVVAFVASMLAWNPFGGES